MTALGVLLLLGIAFFFAGVWASPILVRSLAQYPAGARVSVTNMDDAFAQLAPARSFPAAGVAVALGALIWLRFARRGPYLRVMAVLLGVVLVSGLLAYEDSYWITGPMIPPHGVPSVNLWTPDEPAAIAAVTRIPLIAGAAALLVSVVMGLMRGNRGEKPPRPAN